MPPSAASRLPNDFELDLVVLSVGDLGAAEAWYRDVVGLTRVRHHALRGDTDVGTVDPPRPDEEEGDTVTLGAHGRPIVRLVQVDGARPAPRGATGLYHLAVLLPDRAALAGFVRRLVGERTPVVGAADHHVSEAIYLQDPDGHGVEVYADRPRERWSWRDGQVAMTTEPLDLDDLLRTGEGAAGGEIRRAPAGTSLGHVHLKVRDTAEAERFYTGTVGLDAVAAFPGATFLSVGGYHHHLGANAWESRGGAPAPVGSSALLAVHASVAAAGALEALRDRLGEAALDARRNGLSFTDPSGILWHLHARGARGSDHG